MDRGLKFCIYELEELYWLYSENKGADSFAVTAKLICVFVFANTKSRFSHDEAHFIIDIKGIMQRLFSLNDYQLEDLFSFYSNSSES